MSTTYEILKECKRLIKSNNLEDLQNYYNNLNDIDIFISNVVAYEYIYQKIFLYSCIEANKEIIEWLMGLYKEMDSIRKIGLRQMFFYGKYLLKKKSEDIEWYDNFLENIRIIK